MDGELIIGGHVIDRYRERVFVDLARHDRDNDEVTKIITRSFYDTSSIRNPSKESKLEVFFKDPLTNESFKFFDSATQQFIAMPFYLIVKPDELGGKGFVAVTIKHILGALYPKKNYILFRTNYRKKRKTRNKRWN